MLVHDYYGDAYTGIKSVVDEFIAKHLELHMYPIGDLFSVCICGFKEHG